VQTELCWCCKRFRSHINVLRGIPRVPDQVSKFRGWKQIMYEWLHFQYAVSLKKLELNGSVTKYFDRHASRKTLTAFHIAVQDLVIARESQMSRYHLLYCERTTFVKLPATRRLLLQPYQGLAQAVSSNAPANTAPAARHMAVMRVRSCANLNCTFQLWAIFSHPCAA
jgi:hypothetical protein